MSLVTLVHALLIIESVDSISRNEPDSPQTQYVTDAGISHVKYTDYHAYAF